MTKTEFGGSVATVLMKGSAKDTNSDNIITRMKHIIAMTSQNYQCLRGPRPSGAMLLVEMIGTAGSPIELPVYGYVRPIERTDSCVDLGKCMMENNHCVRQLHAEVDAILSATYMGLLTLGGTIYSINKPCYNCTLHIIKAGIKTIYYAYAVYDEDRTSHALERAGVECIHVQIDN